MPLQIDGWFWQKVKEKFEKPSPSILNLNKTRPAK